MMSVHSYKKNSGIIFIGIIAIIGNSAVLRCAE